jgi:pyrimidine and pyridine-specific 5'-nucleotidase
MSACDPSDIDAQIAALEKYKRTRFDILGRLGRKLAVVVMGNLQLDDILNLRLVRPRW